MSNRQGGCIEALIEGLLKGVAQAIALLAIAALIYAVEIVWNPNNNTSFEVKDEIVAVDGINCNGDAVSWRFWVQTSWYDGIEKKNHAKLLAWDPNQPTQDPIEIEIKDETSFNLPSCEGESVSVAWVYSVESLTRKYVHFRVHPGVEFYVTHESEDLPQQVKKERQP
jgi:hypothetical protein